MSVYVRARDGGLYKDPAFAFEEGFFHFLEDGSPELVIWIPAPKGLTPAEVLSREFGSDGWTFTGPPVVNENRPIPGVPTGAPKETHAAAEWKIKITRRIPIPQVHDGTVRKTRVKREIVVDLPADPRDMEDVPI